MGLRVLKACDELWVCGDLISHGMQAELDAAKEWGIPIKQIRAEELLDWEAPDRSMEMA